MPAELKALRELQKQEEESSDEEQAGEASAKNDTKLLKMCIVSGNPL